VRATFLRAQDNQARGPKIATLSKHLTIADLPKVKTFEHSIPLSTSPSKVSRPEHQLRESFVYGCIK
jgi:hypothetical protein